jgi:hypothetical protein
MALTLVGRCKTVMCSFNAKLPRVWCLKIKYEFPGSHCFPFQLAPLHQGNPNKDVVCSKGGGDCSAVGGSTAAGDSLPAMFIVAGNQLDAAWMETEIESTLIDPVSGETLKATWHANKKGGMTYDMCPKYFAKNILPSFNPPPSAENPVIGICDGHGSHLTLELIDFCIANHIILILRPPHTTHKLQGEDTTNFAYIKADWHRAKQIELRNLYNAVVARGRGYEVCKLGISRMSDLLKPVWEKHFSKEVNEKAWDTIGVYPFTRRVYWDLKKEEAHQSRHDDVEMDNNAARQVVFPDQQDDDEDNGNDAEDGAGDDAPRVSTKFNTGDVCFDGPVTKLSTRDKVAARTSIAVDAAAEKAANLAARVLREHAEIAAAHPVAQALEARFNDPATNFTVDNVNVADLKALLIYHNISFKKSGVPKQSYLDQIKAYYASVVPLA